MKKFAMWVLGGFLVCIPVAYGQDNARARSPITLNPSPQTIAWGYYDASTPPVLRVRSGDTVRIHTLITSRPSRLEAAGVPPTEIENALREIEEKVTNKGPGGHILTGPVLSTRRERSSSRVMVTPRRATVKWTSPLSRLP